MKVPFDPAQIRRRVLKGKGAPEKYSLIAFGPLGMDSFVDVDDPKLAPIPPITTFKGASGGPLWYDYPDADPPRLELAGTVTGHTIPRKRRIKLFFTPIAWHLRLIMGDYPDLAEVLFDAHPSLGAYKLPP